MADTKFSDLTAYTLPIATDIIPIVDVTTGNPKKITVVDLLKKVSFTQTICSPNCITNGVIQENNEGENVVTFEDNQTKYCSFRCVVPFGATSISSIKLISSRISTGNLYLQFFSCKSQTSSIPGSTVTDQTDPYTTYTGTGSDGGVEVFTVPSGAYNGLGSIAEGDMIGVRLTRQGAHANDTYGANWRILGMQFNFA